MKKYRAAVIGTGRIGFSLQFDRLREQPASHAAALASHPAIQLIAGCDIDTAIKKTWKKKYPGTRFYASVTDLLEKENCDIVSIAVCEDAHLEVTKAVLAAGPGLVILEKPVAPNVQEAIKIQAAAKKYAVPVMVNHERRYSLDYVKAKQLINQKAIGEIQSVHAQLWSGSPVWKKSAFRDGSCSLVHDGTHMIDILRFLFDANLNNPSIDFVTKDKKRNISSLYCHYVLNKKIFCSIDFSGNKRVFHFQIDICGNEGKIQIGNGFFKLYRRKQSPYYSGFFSMVKDKTIKRPNKTGYFSRMVENGVDFLNAKAEIVSPLSAGIGALDNCYRIISLLE
ncbi:MAG: Gfo/Idh/MocA family oxidoreductase [Spirochaetales bacterium]|nr:Gfo/Idh/MocA family oxidoreductase [Spirochaetales bacterium]